MKTISRSLRLSIFLGESDIWHHRPLDAEIVSRAHRAGLADANVFRGIAGYGANLRIHTQRLLPLGGNLPLVIVIVDSAEKIRAFLSQLDDLELTAPVVLDELESIRFTDSAPAWARWSRAS
ncbi:DUF190 domain-containing protein [Amycolatopsis sp. NPDC051372]|uniref:DUF190 domain-containing protein n=1 Tax=Amycolatopsis sp. NPDC051372 TaxID=3155669 RepID=UPI003418DEAD